MTTCAPSSLNFRAIPLPKPVPPPVINTTRSLYVPEGSMVSLLGGKNDAWGRSCSPLLADMIENDLLDFEDKIFDYGAKVNKKI